jgi:hypothetical protein
MAKARKDTDTVLFKKLHLLPLQIYEIRTHFKFETEEYKGILLQ